VSALLALLLRRLYAIVDALKRAGRPDRLALVDAMPKTSFEGLTGHIEFDEHGDLKNGEISVYDVRTAS